MINLQKLIEARIYVTLAFAFLIFIGVSSVIAIATQIAFYSTPLPTPLEPQLNRRDMPLSLQLDVLSPFYLFPIASIALALVVKMKCLEPLKRNLVPEQRVFTIITVLGYILGAILTGILLTIAYRKIYR